MARKSSLSPFLSDLVLTLRPAVAEEAAELCRCRQFSFTLRRNHGTSAARAYYVDLKRIVARVAKDEAPASKNWVHVTFDDSTRKRGSWGAHEDPRA